MRCAVGFSIFLMLSFASVGATFSPASLVAKQTRFSDIARLRALNITEQHIKRKIIRPYRSLPANVARDERGRRNSVKRARG